MSVEDGIRAIAVLFGIGLALGGTLMLVNAMNTSWTTIDGFSSNLTGLTVGSFLLVIGVLVVCAGLGVAGEVARALSDIFDSFLGALKR